MNKKKEYFYVDAIEFIHKRLPLPRFLIEKVLMIELDYMRSIGLVEDCK